MLRVHEVLTICEAKEHRETFNAGAAAPSPGQQTHLPRNSDPDGSCIFNDAAQQSTHLIAEGIKASPGARVLEAFVHLSGSDLVSTVNESPPVNFNRTGPEA